MILWKIYEIWNGENKKITKFQDFIDKIEKNRMEISWANVINQLMLDPWN